ncbi:MAG TPA: DUF1501 domain-containing protein [SAR324 cluster bacterium]|jgi:uncharacterized protein (DUF1501 family)|nr:DUF1501 domain-containing protein [SAR324 cluster bacterium]MDP7501234.1 DUF1501 domain-containing protein [SAR324 cluster bacterium]HJO43804.1 DUF1501 domain-containing protein [SAR324 cluster bacterium]|tara:strand:+ start:2090 stop:3640 length:1551 start_codon:yes stop_codon:yes gene_type:complete
MKRRHFLKNVLGAGTMGMLGLPSKPLLAAAPAFSDYKALVCILLDGGNDAWNTFVPKGTSGNSGYDKYKEGRGDLAISNSEVTLPSTLSSGSGNPYYKEGDDIKAYKKGFYAINGIDEIGVNSLMPELGWLLRDGKASLVGNIGTLVEPLANVNEYKNATKSKPHFLFAHNHQKRELFTGKANDTNLTGWAGRLADQWSGLHGGNVMGLNVSFKGQVRMMVGSKTQPVLFRPGTAAIYNYLTQKDTDSHSESRVNAFKKLYALNENSDPYINVYNKMLQRSLDLNVLLNQYWKSDDQKKAFTAKGSYNEDLFSVPSESNTGLEEELGGDLIEQLEAVAQLIYMGSSADKMNLNRQIFYVHFGGFDTHGNQDQDHPILLREVSLALHKFQKALEELNVDQKVATFTVSDFGRTISNNGDGTDHAWSSVNMVVSNAAEFNGGKYYGSLPDFTMGGDDDATNKGRFIPKISVDQMNATLCSWFGVPDVDMATLFPNLPNFKTGADISSAFLKLSNTKLI